MSGLRHLLPRYERISVLCAAHGLGVPVTVHPALGTDTVHQHPSAKLCLGCKERAHLLKQKE